MEYYLWHYIVCYITLHTKNSARGAAFDATKVAAPYFNVP